MVIQLRSKGLYRVTMGTKNEPNFDVEKSKYFNRSDEAFGMPCLSISRDLLFHVEILTIHPMMYGSISSHYLGRLMR